VEADLRPMNLGLATAKRRAQDRSAWRLLRLRQAPEEEDYKVRLVSLHVHLENFQSRTGKAAAPKSRRRKRRVHEWGMEKEYSPINAD